MAKLDDDWVKDLIEEARKKPSVTKKELENWLEYCYESLIEYTGVISKQLHFTCCYLTALAMLKRGE